VTRVSRRGDRLTAATTGVIEYKATKSPLPAGTSLRAGIVGAGLMGRWHAKTIERIGGRVTAVADVNLNAAQRLATSYRDAQSFSDVEVMLGRASLDVIHVCTPPSSHSHLARLAIDAGVNAIIEKPFTATFEDAEYLLDTAAERRLIICPVHQFLFQDGVSRAKALLSRIGRILHLDGMICSAGGAGLAGEQLDVVVGEILPHPLSLMQMFLPAGLPEQDWLTLRPGRGELRAISETSAISLSVFISMNVRPTTCSFQIAGEDGTIHLDLFHGHSFIEPGRVSRARKIIHPFDLALRSLSAATANICRRAIRSEPAYPGLRRLVRAFYEAVRTGSESPISREDTLRVARVRDLLIHSAGPTSRN